MRVSSCTASFYCLNWQKDLASPNRYDNVHKTPFGAKQLKYSDLVPYITDMFNKRNPIIPQDLFEIKKASDNTLLSFEKYLNSGNKLIVSKHLTERNKVRMPYLVIKETGSTAFREPIGLDLGSGEIICLDKSSHSPLFVKGKFKTIELLDENHAMYEAKLEEYFKQIFSSKRMWNAPGETVRVENGY